MKNTKIIKSNEIFRLVLKKGDFNVDKYLSTHVLKNSKKNYNINYLGICVSKKNGNSVKRNKIKRWVREVYKQEEIKLKKNINIVILIKKTTKFEDLSYDIIKNEMISCFEKLGLYEI